MPEREKLHLMARSQSTMCIFLSASIAEQVQEELLQEYPETTPVAVCYHLTWKDEQIFRGELKDLAIIGIGFLIGIFSLVRTGALLPLALVVAYGFLSIRFENVIVVDFIRYAAAYFFTRQQYFEWRDPT